MFATTLASGFPGERDVVGDWFHVVHCPENAFPQQESLYGLLLGPENKKHVPQLAVELNEIRYPQFLIIPASS